MSTVPYEKGTSLKVGKYVTIAKVPVGAVSLTLNLRFVLENLSVAAKLRVAKVPETFNDETAEVPISGQWLQPIDTPLGTGGVKAGPDILKDEKIVLTAGSKIVAYADHGVGTGVTAQACGFARQTS